MYAEGNPAELVTQAAGGADGATADDLEPQPPLVDQVPGAHDYATASLRPGRPVGEAVTDLMHRIHADFEYDDTATTVTSTIAHVLEARAGVFFDVELKVEVRTAPALGRDPSRRAHVGVLALPADRERHGR